MNPLLIIKFRTFFATIKSKSSLKENPTTKRLFSSSSNKNHKDYKFDYKRIKQVCETTEKKWTYEYNDDGYCEYSDVIPAALENSKNSANTEIHQHKSQFEKKDDHLNRRPSKIVHFLESQHHVASTLYYGAGFIAYVGAVIGGGWALYQYKRKKEAESKAVSTDLGIAVIRNDFKQVQELLERGAILNINEKDKHGITPLHYAAKNNNFEIAELLLQFGADPFSEDAQGSTPFYEACINNSFRIVQLLYGWQEEQYLSISCPLINKANKNKITPLLAAIWNIGSGENIQLIKFLRLHQAKLITDDIDYHEFAKAICELLNSKEISDKYVDILFNEIDKDMLLKGAIEDLNKLEKPQQNKNNIHDYIERKDIEQIKKILKTGLNLNAVDVNGNTPLHLAAKNGDEQILEILLSSGLVTEIDPVNKNFGRTPLHEAARKNYKKAIEVLLKNGAAIYKKTSHGRTADELATKVEIKDLIKSFGETTYERENLSVMQSTAKASDGFIKPSYRSSL